ncbi:hypothetical protein GLU26_01340 [Nanohaloarchaea archaeon]|nr:hypothetical protein [Candidatus Nanohaloarchaea archaeon]
MTQLRLQDHLKDLIKERGKLLVLSSIIIASSLGSAILVENYGLLNEDVSVEQAVVVEGQNGQASLNLNLPDKNLVGTGNNSKTWSTKVNANGTVTTNIILGGSSTDAMRTHFTQNISNNNGMILVLDSNILKSDSDRAISFNSDEVSVELKGPTGTVQDAIRFKTRFPINYDMSSREPLTDTQLKIQLDASSAELN